MEIRLPGREENGLSFWDKLDSSQANFHGDHPCGGVKIGRPWKRRARLAVIRPMPSACMTCMGMCMSGARMSGMDSHHHPAG